MNPEAARQQQALLGQGMAFVTLVNLILLLIWAYRRFVLNRPTFAARWSVADLWFGAQLMVAVLLPLLAPVMAIYVFAAGPKSRITDFADPDVIRFLLLPSALLQNVAFFLVPAAFITLKYRLPLSEIGLPRLPRRRDWIAGVLLGILAMMMSGLLEIGTHALAGQFRDVAWIKAALEYEKTNPVAAMAKALPTLGAGWLLLAVVAVGIAAPLGEEMFFRGFVFTVLRRRFAERRWGAAVALVVSAVLFTLPHTYALGLLPVFAIGLLLAWVYHVSGSLWTCIVIHAMNNTASVLAAFFFPSLGK